MKKTLLLCFIHGFKGGDDTFGPNSDFTLHLQALLSASLPRIDVKVITYPQYETRGDLHECVSRFRDWLLEKVIDLEVAAGTPSPTIEPSVRTILVGHSMGGIVAAETALAIASEKPIHEGEGEGQEKPQQQQQQQQQEKLEFTGIMFPYIQGVLAFDTPYLGISPGVVAHGAEGHYNTASQAIAQLSGLTSLWGGSTAAGSAVASDKEAKKPVAALPAPESKDDGNKNAGSSTSAWGRWGKIAMYAVAAGAVAAGGATAYMNRQHTTGGWSWVSSHLEFVGCLARGEELKSRVQNMARLNGELGVGFANLYTRLGNAASSKEVSMVGTVMGNQRTFCNLPKASKNVGVWTAAVNDKAKDEPGAHMGKLSERARYIVPETCEVLTYLTLAMFEPKDNPGYDRLSEDAKSLIASWAKNDWYETSSEELEA